MNFFVKQKLWFFIAMFFMVVTITLLIGRWHNNRRHRDHNKNNFGQRGWRRPGFKQQQPGFFLTDYLAEELKFSPEQKTKLQAINTLIDRKKDSLWEQNEQSKELFSKELFASNPNKIRQDSLIKCMDNFTELFNRTRIEHVDKIRALCNEEQKAQLPDALMNLPGMHFKRGHHGPYRGGYGRFDSDSIDTGRGFHGQGEIDHRTRGAENHKDEHGRHHRHHRHHQHNDKDHSDKNERPQ